MRPSFSLGSLLTVNDVIECTKTISRYKTDTVWIPETWGMECFAIMGAVSQILDNTRIGSSIINIYSRSPSLVAMGAITADSLSSGRLILGLGASSRPIVESFHGAKYDSPIARMREYVNIIRLACSGQSLDYTGEFFKLSGFKSLIKPVRKKIPIYLAGVGPQMLQIASEIADGAILYLRPLSELHNTSNLLVKHNPNFDVACQIITAISLDDEAAIKRAKSTISFYISVGRVYREFLESNGYKSQTREIFAEYKKTGVPQQPSLVPDSMVSDLAICGTPDTCTEQLAKFIDAGVTHPILQFNPIGNVAESFKLACSTFSEIQ